MRYSDLRPTQKRKIKQTLQLVGVAVCIILIIIFAVKVIQNSNKRTYMAEDKCHEKGMDYIKRGTPDDTGHITTWCADRETGELRIFKYTE